MQKYTCTYFILYDFNAHSCIVSYLFIYYIEFYNIDQSNRNNAIVNRTSSITSLTKKDKIELLGTTISNTNVVFFASIEDDCMRI